MLSRDSYHTQIDALRSEVKRLEEINEALREELVRFKSEVESYGGIPSWLAKKAGEADALRSEAERMRGALEEIAALKENHGWGFKCVDLAKKAISGGGS